MSRFERRHRCRLTFASLQPPFDAVLSADCEARFRKKILWHFREFVKWRRRLPSERRSARIENLYETAITHPESYGGRYIGAEAFMVGVDSGRSCVEGRWCLQDGFADFMATCRLGAYSFTTWLLRGRSIGTAFVPLDRDYNPDDSRELESRFRQEFANHWQKFLEWRRSRQPA